MIMELTLEDLCHYNDANEMTKFLKSQLCSHFIHEIKWGAGFGEIVPVAAYQCAAAIARAVAACVSGVDDGERRRKRRRMHQRVCQ